MTPTAEDKDLFYREKDVTYSSEEETTVYLSSKRHYPGEQTFTFTAIRTSHITKEIKRKQASVYYTGCFRRKSKYFRRW